MFRESLPPPADRQNPTVGKQEVCACMRFLCTFVAVSREGMNQIERYGHAAFYPVILFGERVTVYDDDDDDGGDDVYLLKGNSGICRVLLDVVGEVNSN